MLPDNHIPMLCGKACDALLLRNWIPMLRFVSVIKFSSVITGAMADSVGSSLGYARYFDINTPELRERRALRRIVSQQILRTQFVADFAKRLVEIFCRR